jgi:hypothetical protein
VFELHINIASPYHRNGHVQFAHPFRMIGGNCIGRYGLAQVHEGQIIVTMAYQCRLFGPIIQKPLFCRLLIGGT